MLDFITGCFSSFFFSSSFSLSSSSLPARDHSGHRQLQHSVRNRVVHRRTSTVSSRLHWARLSCQLTIAVGIARPQQPAHDRSGHRQTSTREVSRLPGFNQRRPDRSGHRRTSTGEVPIAVGTAGPQRQERMPDIECQKICQIECQTKCMPNRMSENNAKKCQNIDM